MVFEIHGMTLPRFPGGRKLRIALLPAMAQFQSMKCAEHQAEAIGICAYCGRACVCRVRQTFRNVAPGLFR